MLSPSAATDLAPFEGELRSTFGAAHAELPVRALQAAGDLDTASDARFQSQLPFEPVNRGRLEMLKMERSAARTTAALGVGRYVDKRRQAQIALRGHGRPARRKAAPTRQESLEMGCDGHPGKDSRDLLGVDPVGERALGSNRG